MSSSSIHVIKQLFDQLTALPADQRESWLAAQTGIDDATLRHVRALLAADDQVADFTAWPVLRRAITDPAAWLGRRIGAYEIVRELGRGGMGSVFLAQRVDGGVDQQAAIKIVRPDLLDASTLARFRLERQVLAVLQHPNIAGMLDLGELDDGSPYAIMEFVDGAPLDVYVREHKLDLRQRLQLFLHIGDAVAYAHTNMVVHRDLKPGNVLVDRSGRPRLLDFGIAKPLQARIGSIDVEETGAAQRFFSPAHAAPEQLRDGRIGAACDIYGLGVLLYQMLAGVPPFQLGERHFSELEHDILQVDPPAPSRRATSTAPRLRIDRDLDAIVLRCLRKQPVDRYASVGHLADDVRNYLAGRPVLARRGNALYRASRFVARHRLAVGAATAIVAIAATGATLLWRQQLATAEQRTRAEEMTTLIADAVSTLDPNSSKRELTAREVFERVAAQTQASPSLAPDSRARILAAIASINIDLGLPQQAEKLLSQLDMQQIPIAQRGNVRMSRARTLQSLGQFDQAAVVVAEGKAAATDSAQLAPWVLLEAELDHAQGKSDLALSKIDTIDRSQLSPAQYENLLFARARALMYAVNPALRSSSLNELSSLLAMQKKRLGPQAPAVFDTLQLMTVVQIHADKLDEAEETGKLQMSMAETVFGRHSLRYADALSTASTIERARDNMQRAIELQLEELKIIGAEIGEISPAAAKIYFNLAVAYEGIGNGEEAERYYALAADTAAKVWPGSHLNVFLFRTACAIYLVQRNKIPAAHALIGLALADAETYPDLKERDVHPLAEVIARLGEYHANPGASTQLALANAMRFILDNAVGETTKKSAAKLIGSIAKIGIEPSHATVRQTGVEER